MVSAQPNRGELGGKIVSSDVRKFGKLLRLPPLWRFSSFANFWWHIYVKLPFTPEKISSKLTWDISRNWTLEAGDLKKHSHFSRCSFTFSTQMMLLTSEPSVSRFSLGFKTSFQGFFLDSLSLFLIALYLSKIPLLEIAWIFPNTPKWNTTSVWWHSYPRKFADFVSQKLEVWLRWFSGLQLGDFLGKNLPFIRSNLCTCRSNLRW